MEAAATKWDYDTFAKQEYSKTQEMTNDGTLKSCAEKSGTPVVATTSKTSSDINYVAELKYLVTGQDFETRCLYDSETTLYYVVRTSFTEQTSQVENYSWKISDGKFFYATYLCNNSALVYYDTYNTNFLDCSGTALPCVRLDKSLKSTTVTYLTATEANAANAANAYGFSNWSMNIAKTVTGLRYSPSSKARPAAGTYFHQNAATSYDKTELYMSEATKLTSKNESSQSDSSLDSSRWKYFLKAP